MLSILEYLKRRKIKHLCSKLGFCGRNVYVGYPFNATNLTNVFIGDYSKILNHAEIINSKGKFIVGKFTSISTHLCVVTENHTPTVGIPYSFTGVLHINDKMKDVEIGPDCWLGTHVTLIPGARISRGSVVGANTLVNREFPPYAVLVGCPARIVSVKFSLDQILEHERKIYPPPRTTV